MKTGKHTKTSNGDLGRPTHSSKQLNTITLHDLMIRLSWSLEGHSKFMTIIELRNLTTHCSNIKLMLSLTNILVGLKVYLT